MTKRALYFGVELDAKKKMPLCANAAGVSVESIAWGLLNLWEHVWLSKKVIVSQIVLDGCFPTAPRLVAALIEWGFLERAGAEFKVKGATEKLLGVREAQSAAGKANSGNLLQNRRIDPEKTVEPEPTRSGEPAELVGASVPSEPIGSTPALSPTTHHPPPTISKKEDPPRRVRKLRIDDEVVMPTAVDPPNKFSDSGAFEEWFQFKRGEVGFIREKRASAIERGRWWTEVHEALGGDPTPLEPAVYAFAKDPHWEAAVPPMPFVAFMSQWRRFVPQLPKVI